MKTKLFVMLMMVSLMTVNAAETAKPWYGDITVGAYGALEHRDFNAPEYGAGVDIGFNVNKQVSINIDVMAFEHGNWGESTVDRITLLGKYNLFTTENKRINLYGLAGFGRQLETENWLFTAGGGANLNLTKNIYAFADSRVYSEFDGDKGLSSRAGLGFKF